MLKKEVPNIVPIFAIALVIFGAVTAGLDRFSEFEALFVPGLPVMDGTPESHPLKEGAVDLVSPDDLSRPEPIIIGPPIPHPTKPFEPEEPPPVFATAEPGRISPIGTPVPIDPYEQWPDPALRASPPAQVIPTLTVEPYLP